MAISSQLLAPPEPGTRWRYMAVGCHKMVELLYLARKIVWNEYEKGQGSFVHNLFFRKTVFTQPSLQEKLLAFYISVYQANFQLTLTLIMTFSNP